MGVLLLRAVWDGSGTLKGKPNVFRGSPISRPTNTPDFVVLTRTRIQATQNGRSRSARRRAIQRRRSTVQVLRLCAGDPQLIKTNKAMTTAQIDLDLLFFVFALGTHTHINFNRPRSPPKTAHPKLSSSGCLRSQPDATRVHPRIGITAPLKRKSGY